MPSAAQAVPESAPAGAALSLPRLTADTGDLLVLAILLLLLIDSDGSDSMSTLIAIAAFLLLR